MMSDHALASDILRYRGGLSNNNLVEVLKNMDNIDETIALCSESPYISLDNSALYLERLKNKFVVLDVNIQSLNSKFDSFTLFLDDLASHDFYFSAISIQETWIDNTFDNLEIMQIPNYHPIFLPSTCSSHSGLVIYIHNSYQFNKLDLYTPNSVFEGLFIEIEGGGLEKKVILANIYRPPRDRNSDIRTFLDLITPILSNITRRNTDCIITGDFNINLLNVDSRSLFSEYLDLIYSFSFIPSVTLPTRLSRRNATLIDHIFIKCSQSIDNINGGVLVSNISDHFMPFISFNKCVSYITQPKSVNIQVSDSISINNFINSIKNVDFTSIVDSSLEADTNITYSFIHSQIETCLKTHLPLKNVKFQKYKHKINPWITSGILRSLQKRDSMYRHLKCISPASPDYDRSKTNLKTFNTILRKSIREAKFIYFSSMLTKYKNDSKKSWKLINSLISRSKNKKEFANLFVINGISVTNTEQIAENFNLFFASIGTTQASKIPSTNKHFTQYLLNSPLCRFNLTLTTPEEVLFTVSKLKPKTSSGFDNLSTKLLKLIIPFISQPLAHAINQSFSSGVFPDLLKLAKVCPLFKKDDMSLLTNYRPISLLPCISKVFEKIVHNQLYNYFNSNHLFVSNQYGFRPKHSTELATLELIDNIMKLLDDDKIPFCIFMDLSKAFDTLNHNILLHKLSFYGVEGQSLKWFESYLSNRTQYVDFCSTSSSKTSVSVGVPQGSILGPLLFLIYINDLNGISSYFKFLFYADDTTLTSSVCKFYSDVISENTVQLINTELDKIFQWLCTNKLSLNIKKTNVMVFHPSKIKRNIELLDKIIINGVSLNQVNEFNFLGTTITSNLSWNTHVSNLCKKLSRSIGILRRLQNFLPSHILLSIYHSLFVPYLYQSILVWGHASGRVFKLQKRAIRLVFKVKYNSHTDYLFKNNCILKFHDMYTMSVLKFFHKYTNNQLPSNFTDMFSPVRTPHLYNTRNNVPIHHVSRKVFTSKCIRYILPNIISKLPSCISSKFTSHSLEGFSIYAKRYFCSLYNERCNITNCYVCAN